MKINCSKIFYIRPILNNGLGRYLNAFFIRWVYPLPGKYYVESSVQKSERILFCLRWETHQTSAALTTLTLTAEIGIQQSHVCMLGPARLLRRALLSSLEGRAMCWPWLPGHTCGWAYPIQPQPPSLSKPSGQGSGLSSEVPKRLLYVTLVYGRRML